MLDIQAIADIAHKANIPLVVDATFTTPHIVKTIEHGADIVINSLTKWFGGHGTAIGGIVVDAGTFQWKDNPKFPQYNTPDESYNNLTWTKDIGALIPIAFAIRLRVILLRNIGLASRLIMHGYFARHRDFCIANRTTFTKCIENSGVFTHAS